jgi:hypothetical protein
MVENISLALAHLEVFGALCGDEMVEHHVVWLDFS